MSKLWSQKNKNTTFAAEFQWRLAMPISVFILSLLAIPLSEVKPRQGKYARLIPAIFIYIIYANLIFVARVLIQKGSLPAFIGIWWVHGLLLLVALGLLAQFFGWTKFFKRKAI